MPGVTENKLLAVHNQHLDWLHQQPGVARTGIVLSTRTGTPALKIYHDKTMPPGVADSIRDRLGHDLPIEFETLGPGDEIIPYGS